MTCEPISGLSDQRYFHVALVSPHKAGFGIEWIWEALRKDLKISQGRHRRQPFKGGAFEFKAAHESASFAGSTAAREALAISKTECAYDVFAGAVGRVVMVGAGYAALTRALVQKLVRRGLLSRAWFLVPQLEEIVSAFRGPEDRSLSMTFTITGFSAFVPGVKDLKSLRIGGSDVFASGFVEQIEHWLQTRGGDSAKGGGTSQEPREHGSLRYQIVRLKAMGALSGSTVSVSLADDGGCKMWLRKQAVNLPEFANAISTLRDLGRFETTAEPPSWSEENEM